MARVGQKRCRRGGQKARTPTIKPEPIQSRGVAKKRARQHRDKEQQTSSCDWTASVRRTDHKILNEELLSLPTLQGAWQVTSENQWRCLLAPWNLPNIQSWLKLRILKTSLGPHHNHLEETKTQTWNANRYLCVKSPVWAAIAFDYISHPCLLKIRLSQHLHSSPGEPRFSQEPLPRAQHAYIPFFIYFFY